MIKLRVHFALDSPGNFDILQGRECPNPPDDANAVEDSVDTMLTIKRWEIGNDYFYSILFLTTKDCARKLTSINTRESRSTTAPAAGEQRGERRQKNTITGNPKPVG